MAKEILQMDLYALLGIEESAADKEVRRISGKTGPKKPGEPSWPGIPVATGAGCPDWQGLWASEEHSSLQHWP